MADESFVSYDALLEDLPFPIPRALYVHGTRENAEQFMTLKDYRTAASLFTVALQRLGNSASPQGVATLLCKRAECLLLMNYVQHVVRDCQVAKKMIGHVDEHIAYLLLLALELQGEVEEAFGYAIIYKALDPQMKRDREAVRRLRAKVMWLCGQGLHQIYRTIDILMLRGELLFSNNETDSALTIYSEILNLFPGAGILNAHEYRAQCYFMRGDLSQANHDCNRALTLSQRKSTAAFDTKIKIKVKFGDHEEALELLNEWRMIDPENLALDDIEMQIREKMRERQSRRTISKSQSLSDLSVAGDESDDPDKILTGQKAKRLPIRASKQCSGAKPKSNRLLQREEWQRKKEREEIAQELEEKQKEKENRRQKEKADVPKEEKQRTTNETAAGALAADHVTTAVMPSLPAGPLFPERSTKRRTRRKTRNLRAKREGIDDDSDASSVCSISTCPGDLEFRRNTQYRPKMPTFPDIDQGVVSDQPRSSSGQNQLYKSQTKTSNKLNYGIRPRPSDIYGPYLLCLFYKRQRPCFQGKRCKFAHSEEERVAWEDDRRKGT